MNTKKSKSRSNRNKEIRQGNTMHEAPNTRPLKQNPSCLI